jgi:GNAT superfamily N-acetyltransferase
MHLREALRSDISIMAKHHRNMFEEIWEHKEEHLGDTKAIEIEKAYKNKLETEMHRGICKAWGIENEGRIISSGAITLVSFVPNPFDLSSKVAYLHSMYTEKSYRNQKCAQRIIHKIIDHCKFIGVKRIILNASDAGKPIYEKVGFHLTPETMRLFIE